MNLSNRFLTSNDCYRANRTITPKGVMVHSTGVAQPNAEVFIRQWNKSGVEVAPHAIVAQDGVYQLLPWSHRGWHAGSGSSGSANNTHISFEILEPAGHTYKGGTMINYDATKNASYFYKVYQNAVELTAILCATYKLNPLEDGVVICHSEGHSRGIASNHEDVLHWFPKHGKTMQDFRLDVAATMRGEDSMTQEQFNAMMDIYLAQQRAAESNDWAKVAWEQAKKMGVFDGKSPQAPLSREQAALMLYRLGLLEE